MATETLKVIPLGGLGEIGKNMLVLETAEDIVVVDAGVLFPAVEMMGIDVVIPNISYVLEKADKVRAILVTHGHEDHIGALPYVLRDLSAPVYAPRMAAALIRARLKEHRGLKGVRITEVVPGETVRLGKLEVEWFDVCHSIPDSMGVAIRTPFGTVIHTGDFKVDHDPMLGEPFDFGHLARLCKDGVFLLLSDSTYAEEEGYSDSDRVVAHSLYRLIGEAPGRLFVASFASQIARVQIVLDSAEAYGKRVALLGRSMSNYAKIARELGHLEAPEGVLTTPAEAASLPDHRVIYMTSGSQGEPNSALARIARREHPEVRIKPGDTVIYSSTPIPGNETAVYATQDDLVRLGARVVHSGTTTTHVHGHARREELRAVLNIARPRYLVPVHGEYRMLHAHASLGVAQGMSEDDVFVLVDGNLLELDQSRGRITGEVPAGHVYVQGLGVWGEEGNVLDERRLLANDGIVTVIIPRNAVTGKVIGQVKITSRGFVADEDAQRLFADTLRDLRSDLDPARAKKLEWGQLESMVRWKVSRFLHKRTRRRPLVVPVSVSV